MPTNLTGSTISATYDQLLHVDDGPTATEKTVYSGTGVATALKVGTLSASIDNIQIDGNTIRTLNTNGDLNLSPNGTGSVAMTKVAITGGTITGITALAVAAGGTGQTSYTNGQLLIGNSTGNTLTKATLTAGNNVVITNAAGSITIDAAGGAQDYIVQSYGIV